ncbi:MAG TPA: hypothetical protein VGE51_05330 [Fontimonas sp.]
MNKRTVIPADAGMTVCVETIVMELFSKAVLIFVSLIHLLPGLGVFGGERLLTLYGVSPDEPNLQILLRHRAVLFAMLGAGLAWSVFMPAWRPLMIGAAMISMITFLLFVLPDSNANAALRRAAWIDIVAIVGLLPVIWGMLGERSTA